MAKKKKTKTSPTQNKKVEENKKSTQPKESSKKEVTSSYKTLSKQFEAAEEYQRKAKDDPHCSWKEKEAMLLGRNMDSVSNQSKSQVFDPRLSTIIIERMNRVMAQHATGKVRALDQAKDLLPTTILDLVLSRYIIPNADSQYDLLTKFKLQDFYSLAMGSYVSLVDYRIDNDYIGPDNWLVPLRHFFPEANAINDMNHCFIDTWVDRSWLEKRPKSTWKNIDKILAHLDENSADKENEQQTLSEEENRITPTKGKDSQKIHLRTRYVADQWTTYAVDAASIEDDAICRDFANPQGNNEIPVVVKHAFPLMDRFYGLGEFERGKTLQYAINSLWNLYLDGLKMRIFPPMIVRNGKVVRSTLGYKPGARWEETEANSIRPWQTGSQSEQAFQSTYSTLIAAAMNMAGTTNVTTADVVDPGMGKTPEAIKRMGARESSRDAWDRYLMEKTVEKTFNLMVDLLVKKQEKPINFDIFEGEIKKLQSLAPDQVGSMAEIFESKTYGKMKVDKGVLGGGQHKYRFDIDAGTTGKKDQEQEHSAVTETLGLLTKVPGALEEAKQTGKVRFGNITIDFGELMKRHIVTSSIQDWDRIVTEQEGQEQVDGMPQEGEEPLDPETQAKLQEMEQAFGAGMPQQNNIGMNQGGMQ